eukprot:Skav229423  [mRNA]  locus=scaffold2297:225904:237493:+ [translate_table: standard]
MELRRSKLCPWKPVGIDALCFAPADSAAAGTLAVGRETGAMDARLGAWGGSVSVGVHASSSPGKTGRSIVSIVWIGERLVSAGLHREITEWDPQTLEPIEMLGTTSTTAISGGGAIWSLALSKDNSSLFAACDDGTIRILSLEGGVGSRLGMANWQARQHSQAVGLELESCCTTSDTIETIRPIMGYQAAPEMLQMEVASSVKKDPGSSTKIKRKRIEQQRADVESPQKEPMDDLWLQLKLEIKEEMESDTRLSSVDTEDMHGGRVKDEFADEYRQGFKPEVAIREMAEQQDSAPQGQRIAQPGSTQVAKRRRLTRRDWPLQREVGTLSVKKAFAAGVKIKKERIDELEGNVESPEQESMISMEMNDLWLQVRKEVNKQCAGQLALANSPTRTAMKTSQTSLEPNSCDLEEAAKSDGQEDRIWRLVNLEDEMLASGDSIGLVYIWDIVPGRQRDVTALCSNGELLLSGGIDAKIVHYARQRGSREERWLHSEVTFCHSHDIRAMAIRPSSQGSQQSPTYVSGGVAGNLFVQVRGKGRIKRPLAARWQHGAATWGVQD